MSKFYKPADLKIIFEMKAQDIPSAEIIIKPQNQELKEMWCALRFGLGYEKLVGPCTICVDLEENSDADFVIKNAVGDFPFKALSLTYRRGAWAMITNQDQTVPCRRDLMSLKEVGLKGLSGLRML